MKRLLTSFHKAYSFLAVASLTVLSSCYDDPNFSEVPAITYKGIRKEAGRDELDNKVDIVTISIGFQDGDGDLGLTQAQRTEEEPWKSGQRNYEVRVEMKRGNNWEPYRDSQGLETNYSGYFDPLKEGNPGPIEGTLDYAVNFFPSLFDPNPPKDTLRFFIRILDAKARPSNEVETQTVIVDRN